MSAVSLTSLWLPILLSAVLVFVASSIAHMVLTHHRTDYNKLPSEDQVMESLRKFGIPPGDYMVPCAGSPAAMKDPAFLERRKKGPVALLTIIPGGPINMGPQLVQWFLYSVVVSLFAGYLTSRALQPGAPYLEVSRFVSTIAFVAYGVGPWPQTIWYKKSMAATLKTTFDGLIYGFVTGGVFGWLWPH